MRRHQHQVHGVSAARVLLVAGACAGAVAFAGPAAASPSDTNPPLPDVLLMIDTSGSMELMMDGCNPDTGTYPDGTACPTSSQMVCDGTTVTNKNRWASEVAALTGSYSGPGFSCLNQSRAAGSNFVSEYELQFGAGSAAPYDENYYLNYHRPVENLSATTVCAIGFDQSAAGWNPDQATTHQEVPDPPGTQDFSLASIRGYTYYINDPTKGIGAPYASHNAATCTGSPCTCTFQQNTDGLLNQAQSSIRFSLMTFDNDTLPQTGVLVSGDPANSSKTGLNLTFSDVSNASAASTVTTGMWSYFNGWETATTNASIGKPGGCTTCPAGDSSCVASIPFEVGARNPAAPPWEGRMMRFPYGATTNPSSNNGQIMQAITAMRPYGANPIAGMFDDAKYYYWLDSSGPSTTSVDSYFAGGCRPAYIILLSHAAPNLDLQPYCQGGSGAGTGICPYDYAENVAYGLAQGNYTPASGSGVYAKSASGSKVLTYVVGFVPTTHLTNSGITQASSTLSCNDLISNPGTSTAAINIPKFEAECGPLRESNNVDAGAPTDPNAAAYSSCCALARIAYNGGTTIPYFADTSADLNTAIQAILSLIQASVSTRTAPVVLPQTANTGTGGGAAGATFVSSFTATTGAPWSGDVQREDLVCTLSSGTWTSQSNPSPNPSLGDDFANNLNTTTSQSIPRNVIAIEPYPPSTTTLSATTILTGRKSGGNIRPFVNGTSATGANLASFGFDNYSTYDGEQYGYSYTPSSAGATSPIPNSAITDDALGFTATAPCTFKETGSATAFPNDDCQAIAFDYLLGTKLAPSDWATPPYNTSNEAFPARFYDSTATHPSSALGGVYHSTPFVVTPPSALLRDDSYQGFVATYTTSYTTDNHKAEPRHSVLYVQTIDGLLHAFGVDYNPNDNYTFNGTTHDDQGGTNGLMNEMWSFIPPAVMPNLLSSGTFGTSSVVLTDGAPVVKDTIYQRSTVGASTDWHTTLVAGIGSPAGTGISPGYYAMDVTDPDYTQAPTTMQAPSHKSTNSATPPYMSSAGRTQGPHFLWQLTFQSPTTDEPGVLSGGVVTALGGVSNDSSNIFAAYSATPAITTLYFSDPDATSSAPGEVGVAILPGGASAAPTNSTGACKRLGCNGATTGTKCADAAPGGGTGEETTGAFTLSGYVRQWGSSCSAPVAGRTISIVRLDTGEVIRTFGQLNDFPNNNLPLFTANGGTTAASKSPANLFTQKGRFTGADFDSPISGTPVPYPNDVGVDAQKIFFSDQDGTVWLMDVSDTNPNNWSVIPFMDAYNEAARQVYTGAPSESAWALDRSPVAGAPIVTAGRDGHLLVNFGTGDQSQIGQTTTPNYAYSVSYNNVACTTSTTPCASVNWYLQLANSPGEMVTGPQSVFDGVYYFASYAPGSGATACGQGAAYLWGMDFQRPASTTSVTTLGTTGSSNGGLAEMKDPYTTSTSNVQDYQPEDATLNPITAIIPGVAITATAACASEQAVTDPVTGGTAISVSNVQPATYSLTALVGASGSKINSTSATPAQVGVTQQTLATGVRTTTLVDSWASIVE